MEASKQFRLGECFSYGWDTFKRNPGDYLLAQLVLLVPYALLQALVAASGQRAWLAIGVLLPPLLWACSMALAKRGASGAMPALNDAFLPLRQQQGDFLVVALAMASGAILCGIGVIVSWFVCWFAALFVLDGRDAKTALLASKDLAFKHPAEVGLLMLSVWALNLAGAIPCGLGVLVSMPVTSLAVVKAYQQLSATPLLPPTAAEPIEPPAPG